MASSKVQVDKAFIPAGGINELLSIITQSNNASPIYLYEKLISKAGNEDSVESDMTRPPPSRLGGLSRRAGPSRTRIGSDSEQTRSTRPSLQRLR